MSIEHSKYKYISKDAIDLKFSPDVDNNPSDPCIQMKLCVITWIDAAKKY